MESLNLILAKKIPAREHTIRDLPGLYEMLTTGWTIEKEDDYTFKIKDRGRLSNTVRKSDIANFGHNAENYSL